MPAKTKIRDMKYIVIFFFSLVLFSTAAQAQDYKKHTVQKGETVMSIAKKYKVTPYDIYRLNPDSKNGINENAILLIPSLRPSLAPGLSSFIFSSLRPVSFEML